MRRCLRLLRVLWACRRTRESSTTPPQAPGPPAPWVSCCCSTATSTSILLLLLLISLPPYYYYITILTYHTFHNQCPPSTDKVPYSSEEWSTEVAGLPPWEADEGQVMSMKQTLFQYNQDKPSYARWVLYAYTIVSLCRVGKDDGSTDIWYMHALFRWIQVEIDIFLLISLMYMYLIFIHYTTPTPTATTTITTIHCYYYHNNNYYYLSTLYKLT